VVAATPSIAEQFRPERTVTINNYAIRGEFESAGGPPHGERPREVVYVGGLSKVRGLLQMIDAIELVNRRTPATLVLGGNYLPASCRDQARRRPGWAHVRDLGWLSREEVAEALASARAGMLVLLPTPNHVDSSPNKLFEYMAAGLPMIASNFPYWQRFITDIGCGIMVDPHDPAAIAEAIEWVLDHPLEAEEMGQRGRRAFEERFTWEHEAERLVEFYETRVFARPGRR
jgi:glycosyltransferase involved in cell wall biosynthesis